MLFSVLIATSENDILLFNNISFRTFIVYKTEKLHMGSEQITTLEERGTRMHVFNECSTHCSISVFILHNECHPPPAILFDDAVKHMGKVDLRWQQLKVVRKPYTITQHIR